MNAKNTIQKLTLAAASFAALAGAAILTVPSTAHADTGSGGGTVVLTSANTYDGASANAAVSTRLETFVCPSDGSSLSLNFEKYTTTFTEYGKDGAKGGNVEFEWKVEEGES